jgi:hypothetical protein
MGKHVAVRYSGCSVCGSSTPHNFYGVVACDACRVFFKRHVLEYQVMILSCVKKNGSCEVSSENRRCAYCRLKKCLVVGMRAQSVDDNEVIRTMSSAKPYYQLEVASSKPMFDVEPQSHELRRILHFISELPDVYEDAKHEYLEVHKVDSDNIGVIDYAVVGMVSIRTTIELSDVEIALGVEIQKSFSEQIFVPAADVPRSAISMETYGKTIEFLRSGVDEVRIINDFHSSTWIRSINCDEWNCLWTMSNVSKNFVSARPFHYNTTSHVTTSSGDIVPRSGFRFLTVSCKVLQFPDRLAAILEACDPFFRSLSPIDKMVLVRESGNEIAFIRILLTLDRNTDTMFEPFLDNKLVLSINNKQRFSGSVYESYREFTYDDWIDDSVTDDHVFVNLLSFVCLYQERDGLFAKDDVGRERTVYAGLLNKYIESKVICGEWKFTASKAWEMIERKLRQVHQFRLVFENTTFLSILKTPVYVLESHGIKRFVD